MIWVAVAALAVSGVARGAVPVDYDAFAESTDAREVPGPLSMAARRRVQEGQLLSVEQCLGVPTLFWATQPKGARSLRELGLSAEAAARRHLFDFAELYRAAPSQLAEAPLVKLHDTGRGAVIADFAKWVNGVPVFRDTLHVVMNQKLQLVALSGYLNPASQTLPAAAWNLSRATALAVAFSELSGAPESAEAFEETGRVAGGFHSLRQRERGKGGVPALDQDARVKDVWFGLPDGLVPAYHVELSVRAGATAASCFAYVISANDGRVLFRKNLTADAFSYRVMASADQLPWPGPQGGGGSPHPEGRPTGFQPRYGSPVLVTLDHGPIRTNDPWLPTGATRTQGNNVEAYLDLAAPDGFTANTADQHAPLSSPGAFDYLFDPLAGAQASATQRHASVTQAFYTTNFLHDWYYDSGFDEAAGNAQADNFGRGGLAGDSLRVEGQDYGGANNANMTTPADGRRPRMQMYLWDAHSVAVTAPAGARSFGSNVASFGRQAFETSAEVVYELDGWQTREWCRSASPLVWGKIALIDRNDSCTDATKVYHALTGGAVGVLLANNQPGAPPVLTGTTYQPLTIGALSITDEAGALLKAELARGGTVTAALSRGRLRDGAADNMVVAHEWGHYISNRLIGDGVGLANAQGRGMGEGWADFHALLLTARASDRFIASTTDFGGTYAIAPYLAAGTDFDGYYWGIRRAPYSVDFSKNGLTFGHIENGVALPATFRVAFGASGQQNAWPHNSGEVWASMLWEAYVALLADSARLSFSQAQARMKDYLVAAYKATPNNPTFVEAKYALLAVAQANDLADYALIGQAFARRGNGTHAVAPDRYDANNTGVVERFTAGNNAEFVSATVTDSSSSCDQDGTLDSGEAGPLEITLKNTGFGELTALTATVSSPTPGVTFPSGSRVTFAAVAPYQRVTAVLPVALDNTAPKLPLEFDITFENPSLTVAGPGTARFTAVGNVDERLAASASDDVEAPTVAWTATPDSSLGVGAFARYEEGFASHQWFSPDLAATSDLRLTSPVLRRSASGPFSMTLHHRWDFEADPWYFYDGGVIELSTDGGKTWADVSLWSSSPGYNGQIVQQATYARSTNPLEGRPAFVGRSPGWANKQMVTTTIPLGTAFAGQALQVRFRIGTDDLIGGGGWFIDDIAFTGLANTPFNALVPYGNVCLNRPPTANAGAAQWVDEREQVTLDAGGSSDPDGDALTYLWTQRSGPAVQLNGASFLAPEVLEDTALTFELVVSDGHLQSEPATQQVTVRNVNRAPVVSAIAPAEVEERTTLLLTVSAIDLDGDALAFTWSQLAGPVLPHEPAGRALRVFAAEVTEDADVTFQVEASDGELTATSAVTFRIEDVNRPPMGSAGADQTVEAGATVTLTATGSDPDEDGLAFTWKQVDGTPVVLATGGDSATFTAPEEAAGEALVFEVTISDGVLFARDRVEVRATTTPQGCGCAAPGMGHSWLAALLLGLLVARARRVGSEVPPSKPARKWPWSYD